MTRQTTVRFGQMRQRGLFEVDSAEEIRAGDTCVVQTSRGVELGTALARPMGQPSESRIGCGSGACGSCASSQGTVLRLASDQEKVSFREIEVGGTMEEIRFARQQATELGLAMKVAAAEYLLDREKLIFHFTASTRVDFRELVRVLARRFRTRIEMTQVGARDEARLVGDMASCGQELCCRTFLHDLQPVSMRMAKQQKKTLDPGKISGECGKLKCCLRYEDEVYVEMQKTLPRRNSWVRFEKGIGKVVSVDLLLQKLVVEIPGDRRHLVAVQELLETGLSAPAPGSIPEHVKAASPRAAGSPSPAAAQAPPPKVQPLKVSPKLFAAPTTEEAQDALQNRDPPPSEASPPTETRPPEPSAKEESRSSRRNPRASRTSRRRGTESAAPRSEESKSSDSEDGSRGRDRSRRSRGRSGDRTRERSRERAEGSAPRSKGGSEEAKKPRESRRREPPKRPAGSKKSRPPSPPASKQSGRASKSRPAKEPPREPRNEPRDQEKGSDSTRRRRRRRR